MSKGPQKKTKKVFKLNSGNVAHKTGTRKASGEEGARLKHLTFPKCLNQLGRNARQGFDTNGQAGGALRRDYAKKFCWKGQVVGSYLKGQM